MSRPIGKPTTWCFSSHFAFRPPLVLACAIRISLWQSKRLRRRTSHRTLPTPVRGRLPAHVACSGNVGRTNTPSGQAVWLGSIASTVKAYSTLGRTASRPRNGKVTLMQCTLVPSIKEGLVPLPLRMLYSPVISSIGLSNSSAHLKSPRTPVFKLLTIFSTPRRPLPSLHTTPSI